MKSFLKTISRMKNKYKALLEVTLIIVSVVVFAVFFTIILDIVFDGKKSSDVVSSSVMISNLDSTVGGSGVILESSPTRSKILTNAHVCEVTRKGGKVHGQAGEFMISSFKMSSYHDLCLLTVEANLGANTVVSSTPPLLSGQNIAIISGHPALLPNVVTRGHFSERQTIDILTGIRDCTAADLEDSVKILLCLLMGGLPEMKRYEAVLVTAAIMPGSSGSGVFNDKIELTGVVFAGNGGLSYAWMVPYEYLRRFLNDELSKIEPFRPENKVDLFDSRGSRKTETDFIKATKEICEKNKDKEVLKDICSTLRNNSLWIK